MSKFKITHSKKKSILRKTIQNLFLKLLLKTYPNKFLFFKNKIKIIVSKIRIYLPFFIKILFLRLKYPFYFKMPTKHIYAIHLLIKLSNLFKTYNINFFLVCGTLLGAVRQESFAGRPTDIDIGITEKELPKLLKLIPILREILKPEVIRRDSNKRIQFLFGLMHLDIAVYKKKFINKKEFWINDGDKKYPYNIKNKTNTFFKKDLEKLVLVKLYGKYFLAPFNSKLYLKQKYGKNWKIPNRKQYVWKKNK